MTSPTAALAPAKRRRLIAVALLRSLAAAVVLVALYYLLPLNRIPSVPLEVLLAIGLVILLAVASWQVRSIISAKHPTVRAIGALATTVPVFLLLFAATYFLMAKTSPASFTDHLTRTDALYFTVTTFSTVGYGDITAVSESARLVVTAQMILDLLLLGLGIRVFIGAVQRGRQRPRPDSADPGSPPEQPRQQN
jgi:voltage-gated potassium channel Kch